MNIFEFVGLVVTFMKSNALRKSKLHNVRDRGGERRGVEAVRFLLVISYQCLMSLLDYLIGGVERTKQWHWIPPGQISQ